MARKPQGLVRKTPEKWDELTNNQTLKIVEMVNRITNPQKLMDAISLYFIGNLPKDFPGFQRHQLNAINEMHLWVLQKGIIIKNFIPSVKVGNIILHGPNDGLANSVFIEFLRANEYLAKYHKTKDENWLNKFIAVIYRPKNSDAKNMHNTFNGDCRIPYNAHLTEYYAYRIKKLPHFKKQAIKLFFTGCTTWMQKLYPEAFSSDEKENQFGTIGIIDAVAGGKYGTPAQVEYEYTHRILTGICLSHRNLNNND